MSESTVLPPPVQSDYEPDLWSYPVRYGCGHVLHASGGFPDTQEYAEPCPSCANPEIPEFVEAGRWCREQRHATWEGDGPTVTFSDAANALGLRVSNITAMELGRQDPAPLVAFWKGRNQA